jgi:hypothetical protein
MAEKLSEEDAAHQDGNHYLTHIIKTESGTYIHNYRQGTMNQECR